jgi:two-component system sensor histidine kinase HydH
MDLLPGGIRDFPRLLRLRFFTAAILLWGALLIILTVLGVRYNQATTLEVLNEEGTTLLGSLTSASEKIISLNEYLESLYRQRLENLSISLAHITKRERLTATQQSELLLDNGLSGLLWCDPGGNVLQSALWVEIPPEEVAAYVFQRIEAARESPLSGYLTGRLRDNDFRLVYRTESSGNTIILMEEVSQEEKRLKLGIGHLIQSLSQQPGLTYLLLQNPEGIVFASPGIEKMLKIENDPFLSDALSSEEARSRFYDFEGERVLEVVKPFSSGGEFHGLFRVGLSLEAYQRMALGYKRQLWIFAVILFSVGLVLAAVVSISQNYNLLRSSYAEIRSLTSKVLDGMKSGVVALDREGRISTVNKVAEQLFSLSWDSVINRPYSKYFPDDEIMLHQVLEKSQPVFGKEISYRTLEGVGKHLLVVASPLVDEKGETGGAVAVIHDLTELKKLERETQRLDRLREMGDLAAGVAHEIRNPLNAISITAQRLRSEFEPMERHDEYSSFTGTIVTEVQRLNQVVDRFLSLARAHRLNLAPGSLSDLTKEVIELLRPQVEERGTSIALKSEEVPEINLDPAEMKKALINLIVNSIEALSDGGHIQVSLSSEGSPPEVTLRVRDDGPGIPEEIMPNLFKPYFTSKKKGSGLGLAITYRIIQDHGGSIEVSNHPDGGAEFTLRFKPAG